MAIGSPQRAVDAEPEAVGRGRSGFDDPMPKTLATATVDRLLHHAHVLITDGTDSYRLAQATAGKGVMPLA